MLRTVCLTLSLVLAVPVAMAGPVAPAEGRVTVSYVAPETFRDREFRRERSRTSRWPSSTAGSPGLARATCPPDKACMSRC